jgi:hypothetical protein
MTNSELKNFEKKVINSHKRNSLKKLYLYLKKHQKVEKETAFVKVFNAPYTSKKDALLRNELRLLNKELELFMVEQAWKNELSINSNETQLSLIRIYLERSEFSLFEQTWRKLYKKAQGERLYSIKVELINLFFKYKTNYAEIDSDLYQDLKTLLEEALSATVAQMQVDYKELELKDAFIQRTLHAQTGRKYAYQKLPTYYQRGDKLENDDIVAFLDFRIQSYFLDGLEKVEILEKALACSTTLEERYPRHESLKESIVTTEITVALEFFLLEEYEKADKIYLQVLEKEVDFPLIKRSGIYFNYISNLICLEAYDRAIAFYEGNEAACIKTPKVQYRIQYMLCWAYIMRGEYDKPMKILMGHNIQERPENDFLYARLLLAILYYSMEQLELTEREVYNLIQNHRYKSLKEETFIDYSKLIYQHIQAIHILEADKRNNKLKETQRKLDLMYNANPNSASTMMYRWLTKQNERSML